MIKSKLFIALLVGLAVSMPAAAKLYKWVDDKGVTHYGETIPPQYANKDRAELSKSGREVNKKEILTPEERAVKEQADAKKREEELAEQEQKRRDQALLNTYSNSKEIDLARNRNVQQMEVRINSISSQLKSANENLLSFQNEADVLTKAGKKIHPSLQDDVKESHARQIRLQQDLEKLKTDKTAVEARYDADKARYKELTGR